jgi:hypothetical protein
MSAGTNMYGSDITAIRKARALYAFRSVNTTAVNAGTSVLPEQGPPPLNSEYLSRVLGGMQQVLPYPTTSSQTQIRDVAGCACTASATVGATPEITG